MRISEVRSLVTEISATPESQAANLQQVNSAVGAMDRSPQQNAAMVEQSTAAARSLASEADQPARLVNGFKLGGGAVRSEEHTSELQSLIRISYAVFCMKKKNST